LENQQKIPSMALQDDAAPNREPTTARGLPSVPEIGSRVVVDPLRPNQRTGAALIWESLVREGVEVVFGHPGGAIMPT